MLRVDTQPWQQTVEQLREQGIRVEHPRSRERFLGLSEIAKGKSATRVGRETGRNPQTVMEWVHRYNNGGPAALMYRHTESHPSLLSAEVQQALEEVLREALAIAATPPQQRQQLPLPRWSLKRLVAWVKRPFNRECCRHLPHLLRQALSADWSGR